MESKRLAEAQKTALENLEIQEKAFRAQMQARIDHYTSVLANTRGQLRSAETHQDILKSLEVDAVLSW